MPTGKTFQLIRLSERHSLKIVIFLIGYLTLKYRVEDMIQILE
jgi:hypothetical protein